ncbi:MAG: hypothetical protein PHV85_00030 [Desulfovibrionaceae bacterium]|nr:hypothetical protein [Desulfovibrionaceae bacterium]
MALTSIDGYSRSDLVSRLTEVRAAITKARDGQTSSVDGTQITRASLRTLLDEEQGLLSMIRRIDAGAAGGNCNRVQFGRPS